jgi:hypothetical protein
MQCKIKRISIAKTRSESFWSAASNIQEGALKLIARELTKCKDVKCISIGSNGSLYVDFSFHNNRNVSISSVNTVRLFSRGRRDARDEKNDTSSGGYAQTVHIRKYPYGEIGCIQQFPERVDNKMNNNIHSLRSNTKDYGGKTH